MAISLGRDKARRRDYPWISVVPGPTSSTATVTVSPPPALARLADSLIHDTFHRNSQITSAELAFVRKQNQWGVHPNSRCKEDKRKCKKLINCPALIFSAQFRVHDCIQVNVWFALSPQETWSFSPGVLKARGMWTKCVLKNGAWGGCNFSRGSETTSARLRERRSNIAYIM